jgi:hypothetical protein
MTRWWNRPACTARLRRRHRPTWCALRHAVDMHAQAIGAHGELIAIFEPGMHASAQRAAVDRQRIEGAGVRDHKRARLKADRRLGARNVPVGVGQDEGAGAAAADRATVLVERGAQRFGHRLPTHGNRLYDEHAGSLVGC